MHLIELHILVVQIRDANNSILIDPVLQIKEEQRILVLFHLQMQTRNQLQLTYVYLKS